MILGETKKEEEIFMKKRIALLLAMVMVFSVFAVGCGAKEEPAAEEPATEGEEAMTEFPEMNIKMSVSTSDTSTWYKGGQKFADIVSEKTGGKVKVKVYANEQLSSGSQTKGIEQLQNGITDMSFHSTIIYSILDAKFGVVSMPWILPTYEDVDTALNGAPGQAIKDILLSKGIQPLGFGENGYRQITNSNMVIDEPADLTGMKIRIPGINMYIDLFKELGADPTAMNFSEVFTSLQQGTIDGQENPLPVIMSSKLYEVQKYLSLWNYSYDPIILGVNKALFDDMSPELQQIFLDAGQEACAYQVEINRAETDEGVAFLEEKGMEITALTDEQIAEFQAKMGPVYDKYEEIVGKDLMDAFKGE